jgi:hypothetical protein
MQTIDNVAHLIRTKDGDIGGILLRNGTIIDTPSGHGDTLRAFLKKGDRIRVIGTFRGEWNGHPHVAARKIALSPRDGSGSSADNDLREFVRAVDGEVDRYTTTPNGDVNGFRLTDGTVIVTPLKDAHRVLSTVHPGMTVHVEGVKVIGTRSGRRIVANRIRTASPPVVNSNEGQSIFDNTDEVVPLLPSDENEAEVSSRS